MLTKGNIITKFPLLFISNLVYIAVILVVVFLKGEVLSIVLSIFSGLFALIVFSTFIADTFEPKGKVLGLNNFCGSVAIITMLLHIPQTHIYYIVLASIGILIRSYILYLSYPLLDTNIYGLNEKYLPFQINYLLAIRKTEEFSKFKAKLQLLKSKDLTKKDYNRMYQDINNDFTLFSHNYFDSFSKQYKGLFIKNQSNEEFVQSSKEISDKLEKAFNEL